jgi:4-hydroxybenzoate polyprenyltransferase
MTGAVRTRSWRRTVRGYLLLPHLVPVAVVEVAVAGFAVIAWRGVPPLGVLAQLLLAMLGAQLVIGAVNEVADLPFDAVGQPWKPLPAGDVSVNGAKAMAGAGLLLALLFGLSLGLPAFGLLMLGTSLGLAYDLWLKRTLWSWLPYMLALPLLPIWVFTALGRPEPRLFLLYPLGALATIGIHFAQALPDVAIDRAAAVGNATSRAGAPAVFVLAWGVTLSAPWLVWLASHHLGMDVASGPNRAAAGIAVLLLVTNVLIGAMNRRWGAVACFPLIALSTLAVALAWTASLQ